jgi:hypothetical protein
MAVYAVSLDEFKAYISNQQGFSDDTDLLAALTAGERAAENYCQRSFRPVVGSATMLFAGNDTQVLPIYDCTTITAVSVNGVALDAADYQAEPVNSVSWTRSARPYDQLRRLGGGCWSSNCGEANISITGTPGWVAVPDEVKEAVRLLSKDVLLQRQVSSGVATAGDFGFTARLNPYVKMLLTPLCRAEAFGIA